jgi:parallel beta-helix repeat protein
MFNIINNLRLKFIIIVFCIVIISIPIIFVGIVVEGNSIPVETDLLTEKNRGYRSKSINVPKDYPTIQRAIDNATLGDIILVDDGTYYENIVINKSISLIGKNKETTIIDGGKSGVVVYISANWVNISGFQITNSGRSLDDKGITIMQVSNSNISNCEISKNSQTGIHIVDSIDVTIIDNKINLNNGHGIYIMEGKSNKIENNMINSNNDSGIQIYSSMQNTIINNNISNNRNGIYLWSKSPLNEVHNNNIFYNLNHGIYVSEYTSSVNATDNWWGNSSGPYHATIRPTGSGDNVSDFVDFDPWSFIAVGNMTEDIDRDGILDWWEVKYNLDPLNNSDYNLDSDLDGLTNLQEFLNNTNPWVGDTDSDNLGDSFEIIFSKTNPINWDSNHNGIGDGLEFLQKFGYSGGMSTLTNNWIGMTIQWNYYTIYVSTNSSVLNVKFDKENKKLNILISGISETIGSCNIYLPITLVNSTKDIALWLDNKPLNFTLSQNNTHFHINVKYTHSIHDLKIDFSHIPSDLNNGMDIENHITTYYYTLILIIIIIIIFIIIVLFRIRKGRRFSNTPELPLKELSKLLEKNFANGDMADETYYDIKSQLEKYQQK